ncbi:MAG: efflux transporter outer membrane subunit [Beijerinckiaceae bacterium]
MPNHPTKAARAGRAWRARGLACLSAALLSGCAVGPDFVAPPAPPVKGFLPGTAKTGAPDEHMAVGADIPGQWWEVYHSPALKTLVERALKQNADLEAAQAALRAARENGKAVRGALFPTVSAGFNPIAGRTGSDLSSPLASGAQTYSLTTAQLTVAYSPDVFGLTRRTIESADAQTRLARFQLEAAYLALTSNVVNAAVQEASLRAQIEATHKIIAAETELLNVLRRQFNLGQAAVADMLAQEAALAQAEQTLPPLEKALGLNRDLLTALTGQYSSDEITEKFALESLQLPHALPVSLPSALVQHRPDIRAAEANLNSASALIGVAIANRLPLVSLTAQTGSSAANLANLFVPATAFYALGGNVTQTIFDAGTLLKPMRARKKRQKLRKPPRPRASRSSASSSNTAKSAPLPCSTHSRPIIRRCSLSFRQKPAAIPTPPPSSKPSAAAGGTAPRPPERPGKPGANPASGELDVRNRRDRPT